METIVAVLILIVVIVGMGVGAWYGFKKLKPAHPAQDENTPPPTVDVGTEGTNSRRLEGTKSGEITLKDFAPNDLINELDPDPNTKLVTSYAIRESTGQPEITDLPNGFSVPVYKPGDIGNITNLFDIAVEGENLAIYFLIDPQDSTILRIYRYGIFSSESKRNAIKKFVNDASPGTDPSYEFKSHVKICSTGKSNGRHGFQIPIVFAIFQTDEFGNKIDDSKVYQSDNLSMKAPLIPSNAHLDKYYKDNVNDGTKDQYENQLQEDMSKCGFHTINLDELSEKTKFLAGYFRYFKDFIEADPQANPQLTRIDFAWKVPETTTDDSTTDT